jgi:putative phosphoribosyl transferase
MHIERTEGGGEILRSEVTLEAGGVELAGTLSLPGLAAGLVIFAHGSGSSRFSPRNRRVAASLEQRGLGTLLFDLLTAEEERIDAIEGALRFDIPMLADRLIEVVDWSQLAAIARTSPIGLFGASTGAAAALIAAARRPHAVAAVVSRGGRPDLAGPYLPRVRAPTLLVVGGADEEVLQLNRRAADRMTAFCRIAVVPGATHLFEEPGTLDQVARFAGDWFHVHLGAGASDEARTPR